MKGYILKWCDLKMLLSCAFFHDLLKPSATLCKMLQADDVCVLGALEALLKTSTSMEKIKAISFKDLPSVKKVLSRISQGDGSSTTYQGVELVRQEEGLPGIHEVSSKFFLCEQVKVQTTQFLTHTLTILVINGWERTETPAFGYQALDSVCSLFVVPLEYAMLTVVLCRVCGTIWWSMQNLTLSHQGKLHSYVVEAVQWT